MPAWRHHHATTEPAAQPPGRALHWVHTDDALGAAVVVAFTRFQVGAAAGPAPGGRHRPEVVILGGQQTLRSGGKGGG